MYFNIKKQRKKRRINIKKKNIYVSYFIFCLKNKTTTTHVYHELFMMNMSQNTDITINSSIGPRNYFYKVIKKFKNNVLLTGQFYPSIAYN